MPLSEVDRIRMLEALAQDESLKATQRLRAIEELGRIDSRRRMEQEQAPPPEETAPDPFGDFDELEAARQRRARRVPRGLASR